MKKFINANIYKTEGLQQILIDDGKFKSIAPDVGEADSVIDLEGKLVLPPLRRSPPASGLHFLWIG
ncbi:hypothetical protein ACFPFV_11420 [Salinicoccus siamensis]|uniref:hypothetical protein n=1 Tax=Salinicoccus siamensis TaxID=381830 RepID=UPI00361B6DD2